MLRLLDGQATPEEVNALKTWLAASPDHRRQYEQLKSVWHITADVPAVPRPNKAQAWENVVTKARLRQANDRPANTRPAQSRRQNWQRNRAWFLIPALVALVLIWQALPGPSAMIEVIASAGEVRTVTLPDNTVIRLHGESTLRYANTFNENDRIVHLDGDAYFGVTHTGLPFQVFSNETEVHVLGTEFSVRSQGASTEVVVSEGRVRVTIQDAENPSVELGSGEGVRVTRSQISPLDAAILQDAEAWISSSVTFDATPFPEAIDRLSRIWETSITISNPALEAETVTGSIRMEGMQRTLETLCLTLASTCSVREKEGVYFIF